MVGESDEEKESTSERRGGRGKGRGVEKRRVRGGTKKGRKN